MDSLVSIIIPHWNGIDVLSECLDSLKKTVYPNFEIIVVDNASTDGSGDWIKNHHPQIKLINNDKNYGYAGGCNRGVLHADGELVVFLNNDTVQDKYWLQNLVSFINSHPGCAAVQPKILNYYERNRFDYAGGSGGHMDVLCYPFARGRIFLDQEIDSGQYDDDDRCFWASGTAIMVRKDYYMEAGQFDEKFFAHMEEIDLCWKLQLMGYKVFVHPAAVVYHKNAVSLPMTSLKKFMLNHRNSLLMLLTNYKLLTTLYILPLRYALEWVAIFYALSKFDFRHAFGIIKAHIWILLHLHIIYSRRIKIKQKRVLSDREMMKAFYRGSIVLDYYIARKKTYGDLSFKPFA